MCGSGLGRTIGKDPAKPMGPISHLELGDMLTVPLVGCSQKTVTCKGGTCIGFYYTIQDLERRKGVLVLKY